jgi:hypothetical protein
MLVIDRFTIVLRLELTWKFGQNFEETVLGRLSKIPASRIVLG